MSARMMTPKEIDDTFTYHAPKSDQPDRFLTIRELAKNMAHQINQLCPDSREKSLAITSLQEVMMWANASIAIHG